MSADLLGIGNKLNALSAELIQLGELISSKQRDISEHKARQQAVRKEVKQLCSAITKLGRRHNTGPRRERKSRALSRRWEPIFRFSEGRTLNEVIAEGARHGFSAKQIRDNFAKYVNESQLLRVDSTGVYVLTDRGILK